MKKAKFLKTIQNEHEGWSFTKGRKYEIGFMYDDKILIKQPNSPKKEDWHCRFKISDIDEIFIVVD
jgi:hypothetical protein